MISLENQHWDARGLNGPIRALAPKLQEVRWDVEFATNYISGSVNVPAWISNAVGMYAFSDTGKRGLEQIQLTHNRIKMAFAHGGGVSWQLYEGKARVSTVQAWVDRNSNKKRYDALFIEACNGFKQQPFFSGVPILYFEGIAGTLGQCTSQVVDKANVWAATAHNIINGFKTHTYWGGETVISIWPKRRKNA